MDQKIAIIGGGILGCMIARMILDTNPQSQVIIIDSNLIGSGASFFSVGVHFPVGRSKRVRNLSNISGDYYRFNLILTD